MYCTRWSYTIHRACSIVYRLKCNNDRVEFSISRLRASEKSRWYRTWWNRWTRCRSSRSLVSRPRPRPHAPSPNTTPNTLSSYRETTASVSSLAALASTVLRESEIILARGARLSFVWYHSFKDGRLVEVAAVRRLLTDHFFHRHRAAVLLGQHARIHFVVDSLLQAGVNPDAFLYLFRDQRHAEIEGKFQRRMSVDCVNLLVTHGYSSLKSSSRLYS